MKNRLNQRLGEFVTRHKKLILVISTLLLIPALYGMVTTKINYDILTYLPKDLESVIAQEIMTDEFGSAATGMLVVEDMAVKDMTKLKAEINEMEGIDKVIWLDDAVDISIPYEFLPEDISELMLRDNSSLMVIKFLNGSSDPLTHQAIGEIREILDERSFLSGMAAILKDTKELADSQTPIYVGLAIVLATLVLALSLESTAVPFIILISIGYAVLFNFGTNHLFGEISYITKSLAGVLQLGVTLDYSIFLYHRYEEELKNYDDNDQAMSIAIATTASSIVGSSLTTMAGFLAIGAMELTIGKDIGFVMAKGVLLGVISVLTVLPSFILVFDKLIHRFSHKTILPNFQHLASFVTKHAKALVIVGLLIAVPAYYGQANNDVYYNMDESLPQDMESVVAFKKLKDDYNMMTTHMAVIPKTLSNQKVNEMIKEIETVDGIENIIAYQKFIGPLIPDHFIFDEIKDTFESDDYRRILINSEYKSATSEENNQIFEIEQITKSYDEDIMLTGEGVLTKDLIGLADQDFKRVNGLSIAAVFIIIMIVFTSISIPVFLITAILLAIFINMSIPFYTNTPIPFIAGIVIGSIQLGATVDYAILLTTRFREEISKGLEKEAAMKISVSESAKSITTSGMAFFASTVGVALISDMELVKSLSGMIAKGALISTIVILLVLPGILLLSEGLIAKTSKNWSERKSM
ncbi:MAG TPA: MMPL family transporter [Erysipelothrix sp.]